MSKCAGHTPQEDMVYAIGSFRIRQYFLGLDSAAVPFFPDRPPGDDQAGAHRGGGDRPLQMLLTAASMVGSINAIVGGMAVALVLRSLLDAPVRWPRSPARWSGWGWRLHVSPTRSGASGGRQRSSPSRTRVKARHARVTYRVTRPHGQPLGRDLVGRTSNRIAKTPSQQHRQPDSEELRSRLWSAEDHA